MSGRLQIDIIIFGNDEQIWSSYINLWPCIYNWRKWVIRPLCVNMTRDHSNVLWSLIVASWQGGLSPPNNNSWSHKKEEGKPINVKPRDLVSFVQLKIFLFNNSTQYNSTSPQDRVKIENITKVNIEFLEISLTYIYWKNIITMKMTAELQKYQY